MLRVLSIVLLLTSLSGCWFGNKEITARVVIPEGLDQPEFVDSMPIPEVDDPRGLADRDYDIGLPEALSTTFGVEKIVIRKLGDVRWVFLDVPIPTVWPRVVEYWEANNLTIETADPGTGVMVSEWLPSGDGTGEEVFESIRSPALQGAVTQQHKFRLRLEPGVRNGSTEVFIQHRQVMLNGPQRMDQVQWTDESDDDELEGAVLSALAFSLGETIAAGQAVSLVAAGLEESRTELVPDRERPVLKYRLDFNRAWATVGAALENARINVEDLNRSDAYYYVYYSADHRPELGFLGRLFRRGDVEVGVENKYLVHLDTNDDEVHVTVLKDQETLADALIAERLLKIIKEYST